MVAWGKQAGVMATPTVGGMGVLVGVAVTVGVAVAVGVSDGTTVSVGVLDGVWLGVAVGVFGTHCPAVQVVSDGQVTETGTEHCPWTHAGHRSPVPVSLQTQAPQSSSTWQAGVGSGVCVGAVVGV